MLGKPKIGIDIDGCIVYMIEGIRQEAKHRFGLEFQLKDVDRFSLYGMGLEREQLDDIINDPAFLLRLPPIYYARQALLQINIDFEIHLVSARRKEVESITRIWLYKNHIPYNQLKVGHDCKFKYTVENGLRIFIEDRYRNAVKLAEYCNTVYLVNKTYNLGRPVPENIVRVEGWHDILEHLYESNN